ncbi:MFS transporter [Winogradskya humida]|uniref:MFS transporter n=1 Tax=Winogradskya humida TaxID=113566 RepID=UPI0019437341|nr:MFS transporter [Actinoplanes humidus]
MSTLGDLAAVTALSVLVYGASGSATQVSGIFVVRVLPRLFGPVAGVLADRFDLRDVLVVCDLAAGLVFVGVAVLLPSYWLLLVMLLVAESVAMVAQPAARTWLARRVEADQRGRLTGVLTAGVALGFGVGAGIGGLSVGALEPQWALLVNALSFAVSALLVFAAGAAPVVPAGAAGAVPMVAAVPAGAVPAGAVPAGAVPAGAVPAVGMASRGFAGSRIVCIDRRLVGVAAGMVGVTFAGAIDRPAVVASYGSNGEGAEYGLLLAAISVGALVAALVAGRVQGTAVFVSSIGVQAIGHLGLALGVELGRPELGSGLTPEHGHGHGLGVAVGAALVAGVGNGAEDVTGTTLRQNGAPAAQVGTAMGDGGQRRFCG